MVVAIVLVLLVVGSVLFHVLSPWYFTPIASNWVTIDDTVHITFWVTGIVFVVVNLFMAWCVLRYRATKTNKAEYEPENKKLEGWLIVVTSWVSRDARARARRLGQVRRRAEGRGGGRSSRQAVVVGVSLSRSGRRARHRRRPVRERKEPVRHQPNDPHGQDDV
jgi:cytochrome c oxidase subunit 2